MNAIVAAGQINEKHYPGLWSTVYMINAGNLFRQFLKTFGTSFKTISSGTLKIYTNKYEWMHVLEKEISKDQRSQRHGGNLKREMA